MSTHTPHEDGKTRCHWAGMAPEFPAYHDKEWGFPVADDIRLFEKLGLAKAVREITPATLIERKAA